MLRGIKRLPHFSFTALSRCRPKISSISTLQSALQEITRNVDAALSQKPELPRSFPVGKPWRRNPIPHAVVPHHFHPRQNSKNSHSSLVSQQSSDAAAEELTVFPDRSIDVTDPAFYYRFLETLAHTQDTEEAWEAYTALLALSRPRGLDKNKRKIPLAILKRLGILLAGTKPPTRELFMRLLSVLQHFDKDGGTLQTHQWNALVAAAGNGLRKKNTEDFKLALDIFNDMLSHRAPGSNLSDIVSPEPAGVRRGEAVKPDLITYTTLITIAARTLSAPAVAYATSLLKSSGLAPNRITHLSLLHYFTHTRQLSGVRSTLFKMREQGLQLGLDGINACLWAYSINNRVDLASMVYRVLRHNVSPELTIGQHDVDAAAESLANVEGIDIPHGMVPNGITYTIMLQTLAYHGDLIQSLNVFMDMLSAPNLEPGAPIRPDKLGNMKGTNYVPTLAAFRAIFLGFARHAVPPLKADSTFSAHLRSISNKSPWTLAHLEALFESFIELPGDVRAQPLVYWILVAFAKTSGNDMAKLRKVWKRLEKRFDGPWGAPRNRLHRLRKTLFPWENVVLPHEKRKVKR